MDDILAGIRLNENNMYYFHVNTINNSDIIVFDCGYEVYTKKLKTLVKNYAYFLLHCVLDGTGYLELGEKRFTVHKGMIFVLPPNTPVTYYQDVDDPWSYIWINFGGVNAKIFMQSAQFSAETPTYAYQNKAIRDNFLELIASHGLKMGEQLNVIAHFYKILALLIEERNPATPEFRSRSEEYLSLALNYLAANYSRQSLDISEVADYLHLNKSYFSRIFHEIVGSSFSEYLNMLRVQKATELLKDTNLNVRQIATAVGFLDPLYFSKVFKKYRLMAPSHYKNLHSDMDYTPCEPAK